MREDMLDAHELGRRPIVVVERRALAAEIGVERAKALYVGGAGRVVARGCDALGWNHFALRRNAPDCDGQGVCDFGCPTDARKSMNITYVPKALLANATELLQVPVHERLCLSVRPSVRLSLALAGSLSVSVVVARALSF